MRQWRSSGLTAGEFAERRGLKTNTLKWWAWRLGAEKRAAQPAGIPVVEVVTSAMVSPRGCGADFELVLDDGTRVVVPSTFETDGLRRLLSVLRAS